MFMSLIAIIVSLCGKHGKQNATGRKLLSQLRCQHGGYVLKVMKPFIKQGFYFGGNRGEGNGKLTKSNQNESLATKNYADVALTASGQASASGQSDGLRRLWFWRSLWSRRKN
jgi:hypothetical protein